MKEGALDAAIDFASDRVGIRRGRALFPDSPQPFADGLGKVRLATRPVEHAREDGGLERIGDRERRGERLGLRGREVGHFDATPDVERRAGAVLDEFGGSRRAKEDDGEADGGEEAVGERERDRGVDLINGDDPLAVGGSEEAFFEQLDEALGTARITVRCVLARPTLSAGEVARLVPGSVIPIPNLNEVALIAGGYRIASGVADARDNRAAITITRTEFQ